MKFLILKLIHFYQKTLSPDHGVLRGASYKGCRFYPTCSEYTYQAVKKHGIINGGRRAIKRVIRCHPFNKGGHDPV